MSKEVLPSFENWDDSLIKKFFGHQTMDSLVRKYHYGQFRNENEGYLPPKVPYTEHLFSVREILSSALSMCGECEDEQLKKDMCDAALGHDLIEDTDVIDYDIIGASNRHVLEMIYELSNPVDDEHTEQYMEQLKSASEEARLVKYADLIENTISVCYNYHIVGEKWVCDFYRPILHRTLSVIEGTEFPTYPKTAEFLHNMLKVYVAVLNSKNSSNLKQYPVKVLGSIREAIPEEELQAHLKKYSGKFSDYGYEYHWTFYNDEQLVQLFSEGLNEAFFNYLKEKRLFYFFDEQSWDRFQKDYDLWKQGGSPSCTEGNPWLWYEEYIQDSEGKTPYWEQKGQEANKRDKASFFKLIDTLMIPIEFFVPESIAEKQQIEHIDFSTVVQRLVDYYKIKRRFVESYPIKVKAPEREPGSIVRRTDFNYMNGHGTFYRFDKDHFPDNLFPDNIFNTKKGDRISVVLYNVHTDQLDEVVFIMRGYGNVGDNCIDVHGYIADIKDYFEIEISYYKNRPLKSYILVSASAPPDYEYIQSLFENH